MKLTHTFGVAVTEPLIASERLKPASAAALAVSSAAVAEPLIAFERLKHGRNRARHLWSRVAEPLIAFERLKQHRIGMEG
jgi:hypothetical protein